MRIWIIALLMIVSISLGIVVYNESTYDVIKTSQVIAKVSYSEVEDTTYAYTEKDDQGHFWVVDIGKQDSASDYIGHTIDIYYYIDGDADDGKAILKTVIHS